MAVEPRDKQGNAVKFIRVKGRIVPIKGKGAQGSKEAKNTRLRKDRGVDLRVVGQNKYDRKLVSDVVKKHSRKTSFKERAQLGAAMGVFGASVGGIAGGLGEMALDAFSKGKIKLTGKKAAVVAATTGILGAAIGLNEKTRISNRTFNKHYGKEEKGFKCLSL